MAEGVNPVVDTNLGPPATAPTNPITSAGGIVGVMSDLAEMRNRQNANLLFQTQMTARHKLGEDLAVWSAQGLSPRDQIERASHQTYAPWVTPELGNLRSSELAGVTINQTQAATQEIHQRMVNAGLEKLSAGLAATGGDQSKFDGVFKSVVAGYPPGLQKDMGRTYGALKTALTTNLPENPDAAKAELTLRTARIGASVGALGMEKVFGMNGAVAPQVQDVPGGKALVGGLPGQTGAALTPQGGGTTSPLTTPPADSPKALDGSALFAPDSALPKQFKSNLTGTKVYQSPQNETMAAEAAKEWQAAQPRYEQIAQSNATIGNMLDEVRTAAKGGGMLTSGFAGDTRTMAANAINTAYAWFNPGAAPPIDPTKVAAAEGVIKGAPQLAFQIVSQAFGPSREALGTLQMGYNSVPNMDKTPLGNILVGSVLHATGDWLLQKQEFERNWMSRTGGDLTNASAEYLKEHPPEKVMQQVLGEHGIGPDGYTSRAAFLRDFHDGLLTSGKESPLETAATIAHQKGWITDPQFQAAKKSGFKTLGGSQ